VRIALANQFAASRSACEPGVLLTSEIGAPSSARAKPAALGPLNVGGRVGRGSAAGRVTVNARISRGSATVSQAMR
jgi:hypothetical protein